MSRDDQVRPASVRIAAAQYPLDAVGSMEAWAAKVADWVSRGAATGARLLVFPEYGAVEIAAAGGPAVTSSLEATLHAVADASDGASQVWRRLAASHDVHILAPSGPERRGAGYVNAARLFAPGGPAGAQEKLILTPFERDWGLARGSGPLVFDTRLGRIGVAICYDSEFPLLVRAMAEAGAEIVLVPSCTEFLSGYHRVRSAAAARALESQIATVMAPTIGRADWSPVVDRNEGVAGIYVPPDAQLSMTGVLAEGRLGEPGWIAADIDLATLRKLRATGEMRNYDDWRLQPGVRELGRDVTVVSLMG